MDCGATDTVGGYEQVEVLAERSRDRFGDDAVKVDTPVNPTYRFGNQQKEVCLSEVKATVEPLGGGAQRLEHPRFAGAEGADPDLRKVNGHLGCRHQICHRASDLPLP